jgi:DNA-nicking Smr family endonuclease
MGDDDSDAFKNSLEGVRVLDQDKIFPHSDRPRPIPKQTRRDEEDVIDSLLSEGFEPYDTETGEELLFSRPGLQKSVLRRLRRGEYTLTAELDLHGLTVERARPALSAFLDDARRSRHTCVRIVHGKGLGSPGKKPVLKHRVLHWLRQRDDVLALCSARPFDGGTGAAYVLLRKR